MLEVELLVAAFGFRVSEYAIDRFAGAQWLNFI